MVPICLAVSSLQLLDKYSDLVRFRAGLSGVEDYEVQSFM